MFKPIDKHYIKKVENAFNAQGFMHTIGAKLTKIVPGYCEIELPYHESLSQQNGFFHGGIIGTLADNASGFAALSLMPKDSAVLTVEYKLNLISPGSGQTLISCGQVLKRGKTLTVCRSDVFVLDGENKKLCATALLTMFCKENVEIKLQS